MISLTTSLSFLFIMLSQTISRVMSLNGHLSRLTVTSKLQRPTWKQIGPIYRFHLGLASDEVYICPACYQPGGKLLPYHFTLTTNVAVYFCCTSLRVAPTGRYPASCPVKPGLSSSEPFRLSSRDHLACLRKCYFNIIVVRCKALFLISPCRITC